MNQCTCTIQSSICAPLTCTTSQNKNLVNLHCQSTALTDRDSIQKFVRSKNPCDVMFFYWWFYVNSWDKVAGSHNKHSILIRDRFTFCRGTGPSLNISWSQLLYNWKTGFINPLLWMEGHCNFSSIWNKKCNLFFYIIPSRWFFFTTLQTDCYKGGTMPCLYFSMLNNWKSRQDTLISQLFSKNRARNVSYCTSITFYIYSK